MKRWVYLNGQLVPEKEANASILDPGLLYAEGLFETMRSYNTKVFLLERHIHRILESAKLISLNLPKDERLREAVELTLRKNRLSGAYIRLTAWRGRTKTNILVVTKRFNLYPEKLYKKGSRAIISNYRQNENSILCRIKSTSYLINRLSLYQAKEKKADEAIMVNTKGYLAEGSRTNIFLVKKGIIFTPSLDCGILAGITRSIVIELARKSKIKLYQRKILPKKLFQADEAFLTNSLMEVMPLVKINNTIIGRGIPGKLTQTILGLYRDLVKEQCYGNR